MWLLIISCLVLGAVLLYHHHRFDWSYGCLYWLSAVVTYLYPIGVASLLPYILTVCVCCVLWTCGCSALRTDQCTSKSNAEVNSPLYVGERTSNLVVKNNLENNKIGSGSTAHSQLSSDEWIVAAKIPIEPADDGPIKDKPSGKSRRFDSNRYNYLVIQAVSREIRGRKNSLLAISEKHINQNYRLNHVGCYNHNPDTPVVNTNEPKNLGFSSSESAINVALQTADSTVYTYCKCMVSYRPHALFMYLLLLCCPVVYQCYSQPAAIATSITATTVIINLIAVVEINMLQVGQQFDFFGSILKLCNYCVSLIAYIVRNIFIVFVIVGIGISIYYHAQDPHDNEGVPEVTVMPPNQSVEVTHNAKFIATVADVGSSSFAYQWKHNGTNISGENRDILMVNNIQESDSGEYKCTVINKFRNTNTSNVVVLTVTRITPRFTKHPVDMKINLVDDNTNVALICEADGASSYKWEKKDGVIPSDSTGMNTNTLILINVQPEDAGNYRCVATNASGSSLSNYAELIIIEGRLPLRDHDYLNLQFLGAKDAWLGCPDKICDLRTCPSSNENYRHFDNRCWGEDFQIIGEGTSFASIKSGQRIRLLYLREHKWLGCPSNVNCDKRTCPGTTSQGGNFANNRCWGEIFIIYARGRTNGQTIYNDDLVMLYYQHNGRYVSIQGKNLGDDTSLDFCPGMVPPAYVSYEICSKNVFRIYRKP